MEKSYSNKKYLISMCVIGVFFVLSIAYVFLHHSSGLERVLFSSKDDSFMDFFGPIGFAYDRDPYGGAAQIYPPICYTFFYCVSRFIPSEITEQGGKVIRSSQEGRTMLVIYMVLIIWAIIEMLKRFCDYKMKSIFLFLLLFSAPFFHSLERANIIFVAFLLTGHFLLYANSDSKILREWALVALALASGIKIYPAVLGVILIKDKKWKEVVRVTIYGILFMFVPFLIMGGFSKIPVFVGDLMGGIANTSNAYQGPGFKVNFSNSIVELCGIIYGSITEDMYNYASKIGMIVSALALVAVFFNKCKWQSVALMCGMIVGTPGFNFQYSMLFMIFPFLLFLNEDERKKDDWLFVSLFVLQFVLVLFADSDRLMAIRGAYPISISVFIEGVSVIFMTCILIFKTAYDTIWHERFCRER